MSLASNVVYLFTLWFRIVGSIVGGFLSVTGLKTPLWHLFLHILTHYRTPLVITFVTPLSFIFDFFWRMRTWYIATFCSAPQDHPKRVAAVQEQVREWNRQGRQTRMCTARPGWMTVSPRHAQYKSSMFTVNIDLTDILELDTKRNVIRVEPSVNILQLLDYLLPRGYTLPVLPEMDELTVGGLINGYGIETSSHKYGLFCDIAEAFEVVLPDGSVKTVRDDDPLFHAIPWSFGTVGFLTAIELRVQPATKYVRHRYIPVHSAQECVRKWTELQTSANAPDFLEGIMYSYNSGVILVGNYENEVKPGDVVNKIDTWYKPYFYKHCESFVLANKEYEELIPLRQYYQRHNRSIFWALQDQIPMCNNAVFRFIFGWMLPPRVAFLKLIESDAVTKWYEERYVMQDWLVPLENMQECVDICEKELSVYPLWICPHILYKTKHQGKTRAPPGTKKAGDFAHYVDCATIGEPHNPNFETTRCISAVEDFLRKVGGYQGNYSYTYQTPEQYRQMYDHTLYDEMRKKYGGDVAFPESWEKIARKNAWKKKDN